MNIFDFINSRDIARYLKEIEYQFSALECAWLVWQSHKHSLKQKHEAWQELVHTTPDCSVAKRTGHNAVHSLHTYLLNYMELQNREVKRFFTLEPQMFYNGTAYGMNGSAWDPSTHLSVEACIEHYRQNYRDWCDINSQGNEQVLGFTIDKFQIGETTALASLSVNSSNEVLSIYTRDMDDLFESLWFEFRTPFENGDIVVQATNGYRWLYPGTLMNQFVLDKLCTDDKERVQYLKANGGYKDMLAYGHGLCDKYNEMYSYMDLEYFTAE